MRIEISNNDGQRQRQTKANLGEKKRMVGQKRKEERGIFFVTRARTCFGRFGKLNNVETVFISAKVSEQIFYIENLNIC